MVSPRVALGSRTLARARVAAPTRELARAKSSAGWALLSPPRQARVEALLSGNTPISDGARSALARQGASWDEMPAQSQQQFLSKLLGTDFRPGFVREYAPPLSTAPARFTCAPMTSEPWQQFQGRPADIQRTTLRFGKHDILYREPVTLEPGVVQHSREQVTQALAQLPRFLREAVSIVALSPFTNVRTTPDGKSMPVYMEAFPGIAGVNEPTIVIYAQSEQRDPRGLALTLLHEMGHLVLGRALTEANLRSKWDAAVKSDGMGPSQYAGVSASEYLAEVFALYLSSRGTPSFQEYRRLFPKQFEVMGQAVKHLERARPA